MNKTIGASIFPNDTGEYGVLISTSSMSSFPTSMRENIEQVSNGQEIQFIELMFAAHFAIRQLSHFGDCIENKDLTMRLRSLVCSEEHDMTILRDPYGLVAITVPPIPQSGKRIVVEHIFEGSTEILSVTSTGFGFLNRKLVKFMPSAVVSLFLGIASLHSTEREFVRRLLVSTFEIDRQWRNRNIWLSNHFEIAFKVASKAWAAPDDGQWLKGPN